MSRNGSNHLKDVVLPIVLTVLGIILIAICLGTWLRRRRLQFQRQLAFNGRPMGVSLHIFRHGSPGIHFFIVLFFHRIHRYTDHLEMAGGDNRNGGFLLTSMGFATCFNSLRPL